MILPPLYLNGFPKSGLHMADLMVGELYKPFMTKNWLGTNAWTNVKLNMDKLSVLSLVKPGQYIKGHSGHSKELETMLTGLGFCVVLIYRDLRDVVVSQAYHILSDDENLKHPARELYPDNLQEVMKLVITGIYEYDGIFARWESFEPWLSKPWVFPIKYRDLRLQTNRVARDFLHYLVSMEMLQTGRREMQMNRIAVNQLIYDMVERTKHKSVTFRRGKPGQWHYEFTPEIRKLFKEYDKTDALIRLGFVKNRNWN